MANQVLLDYIKSQQQAGVADSAIQAALLEKGWQATDVDNAFAALRGGGLTPVPTAGSDTTRGEMPKASALFSLSWAQYKKHFKTWMGIYALPYVFFVILVSLFGGGAYLTQKMGLGDKPMGAALGTGFIVIFVALLLLGIALFVWAQAALLIAVRDEAENVGISEAYKRAKPVLGRYFLTGLLVGLVVLVGLVLLIVPGIIFALWYYLAAYIALDGKVYGIDAMKLSKKYVQTVGIGKVFSRFAFIALIGIGLSICTTIVAGLIGIAIGNKDLANLLGNIVNLFWTPLVLAYAFHVYRAVKTAAGE